MKKFTKFVATACVAALALSAIPVSAEETGTFKIGGIGPITGSRAAP